MARMNVMDKILCLDIIGLLISRIAAKLKKNAQGNDHDRGGDRASN